MNSVPTPAVEFGHKLTNGTQLDGNSGASVHQSHKSLNPFASRHSRTRLVDYVFSSLLGTQQYHLALTILLLKPAEVSGRRQDGSQGLEREGGPTQEASHISVLGGTSAACNNLFRLLESVSHSSGDQPHQHCKPNLGH